MTIPRWDEAILMLKMALKSSFSPPQALSRGLVAVGDHARRRGQLLFKSD